MATTHLFTRREIEGLIAAGNSIVIKEKTVLRLDAWKDKHPGGDLVIKHMVSSLAYRTE
jgi:delta8-fatty-acid desaturase